MTKISVNSCNWFGSLPGLIVSLYKGENKNPGITPLEKTLHELLVTNFKVWGYEDEARRTDVPDKTIAGLKRNIDRDNQKRNDLIDAIDAIIKEAIEQKLKQINGSAPLNSETPGSVFDRLTVLALRAHNLKKEIERRDAGKSHTERCANMLKQVRERSKDLLKCLEGLLDDYYSGRKLLKSYKQHKLYNDPDLNPSLRK
ncbi:MAG: DUF4254 domain-containing protein [Candidatus Omnitrophica bacterium]|nr:DUF4254 domain-containing protein [Candidatus Omnitrophota bacterium]